MDFSTQQVHPNDVKPEVQAQAALQLRMQGYSYRKIGSALGMSHAHAHRIVVDALRESRQLTREMAEEARQLELDRLDDIWRRLYPRDLEGRINEATARTLLRISQQRAALLGLPVYRALGPDEDPSEREVDLSRLSLEELRQLEALQLVAQGRAVEQFRLDPEREVWIPTEAPEEPPAALPAPDPE